jgi:long-subunit acyl-CoA synthetase (AMP-forming)
MVQAFEITSAALGDRVAIRTRGDEQTLTWAQWHRRARDLAGGLHRLGLRRGQTLAIMLSNCPEFHVADMAAVTLGAAPFSIYQTYAPNQIEFVVADAGARIAVVEAQYLDVLLQARAGLPDLEHVILIDPPAGGTLPEGIVTLAEIERTGRSEELQRAVEDAAAAVAAEDVLTLIYTSGTTGPPKGVQLCHRNLMAAVTAIERMVQFPDGSRVISWLPAAHIAERAAHHYVPIVFGLQITSCSNPREVMSYLPEVRPQWFFAVPRIWEKLKSGLETMLAGLPQEQRTATEAAIDASLQKVRLEQRIEPVPAELAAQVASADEQVFAGLREMLGLDQLRVVNVGAAPTPVEVLEFFHAIGIPLAELWGMSETCGAGCVNPPEKIKIGTVGPPAPGVEVGFAQDGELLIRGDVVMLGYRGAPEKTHEAIDSDGWLHTGDIAEQDEDGYVRIVDRKKELIINAAGKNMSPANIEAKLKAATPLIAQAVAIGDNRPYNVALLALDAESLAARGLASDDPAVVAEIATAVEEANARLSRVEQIKRYEILDGEWLPGGEELTPTMKLKRRPIERKYEAEIETLYA